MVEDQGSKRSEVAGETDALVTGPGVVATKSQARGGAVGIIVGAIVGALLGLVIGIFVDAMVVTIIVGAVAGAVFGGVAAGGQNPKQKLGRGSEGDV